MSAESFTSLQSSSSVAELPSFACCVPSSCPMQMVADAFEQDQRLPGVLVVESGQLRGLLSRDNCMAVLSRPFALELYLRRPVSLLLDEVGVEPLVLSGSCGIAEAAHSCLSRPSQSVFEPIVVDDGDALSLLDAHTLLLAQSRLLEMANQTIRQQKQAAEAANIAKSQFLANMSHEIRTPLTAVLGFAENLLAPALPTSERVIAARTIVRNGEHLLKVINEILDLSKIEAGKLDVELIRCSPAQLVFEVMSVMRVRAIARQVQLEVEFETAVPETILTDGTRLRQILMNLVGNAIKFTDAGRVDLQVRLVRECSQGSPQIVFSVADTGIGMTPQQLELLFQPFTQADGSMARRFGGTGLGLTISRNLARKLGGDIDVQSRFGEGSIFSVSIETGPLDGVRLIDDPQEALVRPMSSDKPDAAQLCAPCRLLLVDDSPDNQLLISRFLQSMGAHVETACDGRTAMELALAADHQGRPFDVVLMDMQMPILDGYAATRQLRSSGYTRPIVALTANAMKDEMQHALNSGCDAYATKPVNRSELINTINHQLQRPDLTLTARDESPSRPAQRTTAAGQPSHQRFDVDAALHTCADDAEILHDVAETFLGALPDLLDKLQRAWNSGDNRTVTRLVHTIKSSAANFGDTKTAALCQQLERSARTRQLSELVDGRQQLQQLLGELSRELDNWLNAQSLLVDFE